MLGPNRYGKAEVRLVHVERGAERHRVTDLTVGIALSGELTETHLTGDNSRVLPTDSQKNTVYAFAREFGVGTPETFALRLARHFTDTVEAVRQARVSVEQHAWQRTGGRPHSFSRAGGEARTATVTCRREPGGPPAAWTVSGLSGLTVLNTSGSEFRGFPRDRYTTLAETGDRLLATSVDARWRHTATEPDPDAAPDWDASHTAARELLLAAFADTYSRSLQQTLYAMGQTLLRERPELAEVRLSLPNRHHFLVDLDPFGLDNPGEVFYAADRPYGLIEGTVLRDELPTVDFCW